ncbi:MAG: hypothetical protein H3C43_03915 [Leptonema sp. (in: Bacteria)]|nr:hypothetical protein [Leptonema sp. (in: bacteria)]
MNRYLLFILLLFSLSLSKCQPPNYRETAEAQLSVELRQEIGGIQDQVSLLAGMPLSEGYRNRPEVAAILKKPYYLKHQKVMQSLWQSIQQNRIDKIIPWQQEHIGQNARNKTAFYPLSGGDIVNFSLIYPQADRYIMVAMEKRGDIPNPVELTESQLQGGLVSVEQMIENIARTGYFFSRLMNQHMNPEKYGIFGTMPTVAVFLVQLGHTLQSIEKTCIDDSGKLMPELVTKCDLPSYRIRFRDGRSGIHKEVIYISARIVDSLFQENKPSGKFFQELGRTSVMLKAAVYLLHSPKYKGVADFILNNADIVVQDDSGLPYRYFEADDWTIKLYGAFVGPPQLTGIQYYPQHDLVKAFREKSNPLPFEFGYGQVSASHKSGMIVAVRK